MCHASVPIAQCNSTLTKNGGVIAKHSSMLATSSCAWAPLGSTFVSSHDEPALSSLTIAIDYACLICHGGAFVDCSRTFAGHKLAIAHPGATLVSTFSGASDAAPIIGASAGLARSSQLWRPGCA